VFGRRGPRASRGRKKKPLVQMRPAAQAAGGPWRISRTKSLLLKRGLAHSRVPKKNQYRVIQSVLRGQTRWAEKLLRARGRAGSQIDSAEFSWARKLGTITHPPPYNAPREDRPPIKDENGRRSPSNYSNHRRGPEGFFYQGGGAGTAGFDCMRRARDKNEAKNMGLSNLLAVVGIGGFAVRWWTEGANGKDYGDYNSHGAVGGGKREGKAEAPDQSCLAPLERRGSPPRIL